VTYTTKCPGCGKAKSRGQFACGIDWFRLPLAIRQKVNAAQLRQHGEPELLDAARDEAVAWYREHPEEVTSGG
jgi:hypothetical protein